MALAIGSVSLFADSIDFIEDAAVNGLILIALNWNPHRRSLVGMALAAILLAPGLATLWTAWEKIVAPLPPAPSPLSLAGGGALAVNLFCAGLLARFRTHSGSLTSCISFGPQRCTCECCHRCSRSSDDSNPVGLARPCCRPGNFPYEPGLGA